jgi:hypothetical protein
MNREKRKLNKLVKEFKALTVLKNEAKIGNQVAANINTRIERVNEIMMELYEIRKADPNFINGEFFKELEAEKRMLINLTLQYGWPKTYLANLFKKQKEERIINQNHHAKTSTTKPAIPNGK